MKPLIVSEEDAKQFQLFHGDSVTIHPVGNDYSVSFKVGSTIYLPKAISFNRQVAGLLPKGWDATKYGISKDIVDSVDPVTLYGLVSTAEALSSAGVCDPFEFFEYCHVTEVSNSVGSGMGGAKSIGRMFFNRKMK